MDVYEFNTLRYPQSTALYRANRRIQKLVALTGTGNKILDLGCMDGCIGQLLIENGNTVSGIDASKAAIPRARERAIDARVGDLNEPLDFPDASFDVVVAGEIIEHVHNVDGFLDEIHRVLRPSGSLVISTPNLASLPRRLLLLFNRNPHIETSFAGGTAAGHIRYFVKHSLFSLLRSHSFHIDRFTSDAVNLTASGKLRLCRLADLCPSLGATLIVRAVRMERAPNTACASRHEQGRPSH